MEKIRNKSGAAILYVVLAAFFVIFMSGLLINVLTFEIKVHKKTEERIIAKYRAEAGVEHALLEKHDVLIPVVITDGRGANLYEYTVDVNQAAGTVDIEAYGYLNGVQRMRIYCVVKEDQVITWEETPMN